MDEKEYIEKKEKHDRIVALVAGVWLITALPLLMMPVNFVVFVLTVLSLPIVLSIIRMKDDLSKNEDMLWFSGESMDRLILGMMKIGAAFIILGSLEAVLIMYMYFEKEMVDEIAFRVYVMAAVFVVISYLAMVAIAPAQRRKFFGNWRVMKTSMVNVDDMRETVKKALDDLNIEYEVHEKKKAADPTWHIVVEDKMKIVVEKAGVKKTRILISQIPDEMQGKERELEKEILRLIVERSQ